MRPTLRHLFVFAVAATLAVPLSASAFSIGDFFKSIFGVSSANEVTREQLEPIPDPAQKPFPFLSSEAPADPHQIDTQIVDDTAIASSVGPLGNVAEAAESSISYKISTYTVRRGDTLVLIAKTFDVSDQTIRWANNIPKGGKIKEGDVLVILPVSGVKHTVKKGETVALIAKKYGGDPDDIVDFNDLDPKDALEVGAIVLVPDGEVTEVSAPATPSRPAIVRGSGPELVGYYLRPLSGGTRSRGIHGYNGVDIAANRGTPVRASASGTVIIARGSGWNGGYGSYIVIAHANGTQTLYAHLSSVHVSVGQSVLQGQDLGAVGSTGKSTGNHLHFEVRGAKNPF
ncbi:MAG: M23 family metallopeptidase [Candidatus Ryanbacteria bacterium]|nr:M23 family metallopeptidase [Candidatus Ryanbacteria bacterium]